MVCFYEPMYGLQVVQSKSERQFIISPSLNISPLVGYVGVGVQTLPWWQILRSSRLFLIFIEDGFHVTFHQRRLSDLEQPQKDVLWLVVLSEELHVYERRDVKQHSWTICHSDQKCLALAPNCYVLFRKYHKLPAASLSEIQNIICIHGIEGQCVL